MGSGLNLIRKLLERTNFEPITLERGVTHDPDFGGRPTKGCRLMAGLGSEMSPANLPGGLVIELLNEAGQLVKSYLAICHGRPSPRPCRGATSRRDSD